MIKQEKEYIAWGLSRLAIRNIIVFFYAVMLFCIAALWQSLQIKEKEKDILNTLRVECERNARAEVMAVKEGERMRMEAYYRRVDSVRTEIEKLNYQARRIRLNRQ